jgi:hypothetical protein
MVIHGDIDRGRVVQVQCLKRIHNNTSNGAEIEATRREDASWHEREAIGGGRREDNLGGKAHSDF